MKAKTFTLIVLIVGMALMSSTSGTLAQGQVPTPSASHKLRSGQALRTSQPSRQEVGSEGLMLQQHSQNVELIGQIGSVVNAVAVQGQYAYIGVGPQLIILDISNPAAPSEAGYYDTPGSAWGVAMAEDYAYVADRAGGLRIVDVSNPSIPNEVGSYITPGDAIGVAIAGNYAYVAKADRGLRIVDVSNPAAPTETGFYDTPGDAYGVAVVGNYAYVADGYGGLRIVDVSNPAAPTEAGFYDTVGEAKGVAVAGNYAYVADYDDGLVILRYLPHQIYLPLVLANY